MSEAPVPQGPGRDEGPSGTPPDPGDRDQPWLGSPDWTLVPSSADWPDWHDDAEFLAADEYPGDLDDYEDPDNAPPPGLDDAQLAALIAEASEATAEQARAAEVEARLGNTGWLGFVAAARRGPGMPGSARSFPGEYTSRASGFASGKPLDLAPGCPVLAQFAEEAAGGDDRYVGASDDELLGAITAWDRVEANASARKHAAAAELLRRRPAPGVPVDPVSGIAEEWDEFVPRELGVVLGEGRDGAETILALTAALETSLPGTKAAFRSGVLSRRKAMIIATATQLCDPAEARAAEALVLGRAARLTPGALKAAITRAVMDVAPEKARKRRERGALQTRVERWFEDTGNAGLAGRELPPAQALAADQRITWWARQLRSAGLDGDMDHLRAKAMMDILLGMDSRPPVPGPDSTRSHNPPEPAFPAPAGPLAGVIPPGFAGHVNLTVTLPTLINLADRPGELGGIGPIDPDLSRDLAAAAARSARSSWCVTVTDQDGHAIGHGCARPEPQDRRSRHGRSDERGAQGGPGPPGPGDGAGGPDPPDGPPFTFAPAGRRGPPSGYGSWRLSTGIPGPRDFLITLDPIPSGDCDHRWQARGHDPGVKLRHLTEVRHATCTGPGCRRPAAQCDFEHNIPHEVGGRTCICNGDPKCRFDHRMKQDPRWKSEKLPGGYVRWTTPSGRQYTTEPTRYPI
jgi:hypothetical protein